jgi:hypothetical protein
MTIACLVLSEVIGEMFFDVHFLITPEFAAWDLGSKIVFYFCCGNLYKFRFIAAFQA